MSISSKKGGGGGGGQSCISAGRFTCDSRGG